MIMIVTIVETKQKTIKHKTETNKITKRQNIEWKYNINTKDKTHKS